MTDKQKDITIEEAQKIVHPLSAWKVVNSLIQKGYIQVYENLNELYKTKQESYIFLNPSYQKEEELKKLLDKFETKLHYQNILLIFLHLKQTKKNVSQKELISVSSATAAQLKYLIDKQILIRKKMEVDRVLFEDVTETEENRLSDIQENAYQEIKLFFQQKKTTLLKGITGSGKTHIYMQLIQDCIQQGKQALYLLPEIALTTQIIQKLRAVFGNKIGVYHSRFSNQERVELWKKVQTKQFEIVVGSRSALLLPYHTLGLIIVDEEHDFSYKQQDPAPRYHARDAAIYLAHKCNASILLGTATPSIETYQNCIEGKFGLVELSSRYGEFALPKAKIIDLKKELSNKTLHKGIFSLALLEEIKNNLEQKKQIILFQNRRGYAPFIQCELCGWVPQCKNCDVSLTYHKTGDTMQCHYCHTKSALPTICLACGSNKLTTKSFGTEKIEEEISKIFPYARVKRFDWDNLKIKNQYTQIIHQFEKREIDILVGTQMVVKGLDFEHVQLVGILSADRLLSYPDFRVNERAFQLIEQVSGRAGRKDNQGKVLIQLFNTSHPLLPYILNHDYHHFFLEELKARKEFLYPPFSRLIRIILKHKNETTVKQAAQKLFTPLQNLPKSVLFGPAEPDIHRIKNFYIQEILIKTNKQSAHLIELKKQITQQIQILQTTRDFTSIHITLDVDP